MTGNRITIQHAVLVSKPAEAVWDYTQNYDNRAAWDSSVTEAVVLQTIPQRIIRLKLKGGSTMTFVYKQDERPYKTSLAAKEIISPIIAQAGGSWTYEEKNGKTLWIQTNTIVLKKHFAWLLPFCRFALSMLTKKAMQKAKREIEKL